MAELKGIKDVRLIDIMVRKDRVTPLSEAGLALILQSVEEVGEIRDAIHLRKVKGGYELIDGLHRMEAARRIGNDSIRAQVWHCTLAEARLMETDANVTFIHMSAVDLAVSLAGRKEAWVKLHPETAQGSFKGNQHVIRSATEMSFTCFISEVIGVSKRQIERVVAAGDVLDQNSVIALRKAPKRVAMSDLYQIAKAHGADERDYILKSLVAGEAKNAAAARRAYAAEMNGEKPTLKDPVEEGFKALLTAWKRAPAAAKRRFVDELQADIYPMIVSGYSAEATP